MVAYVADRGTATNLTAQTSTAVTLPNGSLIAVGNVLICRAGLDNAATGGAAPTIVVTDPRGNTWSVNTTALRDPGAANAGTADYVLAAQVTTAYQDGDSITFGFSGVSVTAKAIVVEEWSSISLTGVTTAQANNHSGIAQPSVSIAVPAAGALVYGCLSIEGKAGDSYTEDTDTTDGTWTSLTGVDSGATLVADGQLVFGAYKIPTGTTSQSWDPVIAVGGRDWAAQLVVFPAADPTLTGSIAITVGLSATLTGGIAPDFWTAHPEIITRDGGTTYETWWHGSAWGPFAFLEDARNAVTPPVPGLLPATVAQLQQRLSMGDLYDRPWSYGYTLPPLAVDITGMSLTQAAAYVETVLVASLGYTQYTGYFTTAPYLALIRFASDYQPWFAAGDWTLLRSDGAMSPRTLGTVTVPASAYVILEATEAPS